jgi:hypothetical protein
LIKVVVFPLLFMWLWHLYRTSSRDRRNLGVAVHGGAAVALSLALSAPFLDSARALGSLLTLTSVEGWASPARLVARGVRALGDTIGGAGVANAFGKLVVVGFLLVFAAAFIRYPTRRDPDRSVDTAGRWANSWALGTVGLALSIPYLLPWYAAWFLPFLAVTTEVGVAVIGFAVAGLLALTGVPAEPGSAPGVWRGMVLGVHYVIAPIMLALFLALVVRVLKIGARGPTELGDVPRMADRARP